MSAAHEIDLALLALRATRRQVMADLDAIEARIRRIRPGAAGSVGRPRRRGPIDWKKRLERAAVKGG